MVDSINNGGAVSTLLRAQAAGAPALNAGQQAARTLIVQKANGATPLTVQPSFKSEGSSKSDTLPRGSIVDVLA